MISLGQRSLTVEDVFKVAMFGEKVSLGPKARSRISQSSRFLKKEINSGATHYGINTGFGFLSNVKIDAGRLEALQENLIRSHASGVGPRLDYRVVRAMLFLRAADLARGYSGARSELIQLLVGMLNQQVHPVIPEQGSLGASGDLAPLSHMALVVLGEGEAQLGDGKPLSGSAALQRAKLKPIKLGPKEGLALINGTQFMSAMSCLNLIHAEYLSNLADAVGALSLEALRGTSAAFDEEIHALKPHEGQVLVAKRLRNYLRKGGVSEIAKSHADCDRVQDPYSLRCMPQVHGASRDAIAYVRKILETEINSVTDNPLLFPQTGKVISGGNFHGQYLAMAMDWLSIALAEFASISEQRISKMVNPALSGLPAFLTQDGGVQSGLMIVHYVAASLVSENKTLSHPACVDSIPTSADKEDHVSMGAWAARKAQKILDNTRRVLAMELLCACQGIDLLRPLKTTPALEKIVSQVRKRVPPIQADRVFQKDIEAIETLLRNFEIDL